MTVKSSAIEESSFKLNMTQMEYDFQAWKVFDSKMDSLQTPIAHTKLQWRLQARAENEEAVKKWMGGCMQLMHFDERADLASRLFTWRASIAAKLQDDVGNVVPQGLGIMV